MKQNFPFLIFLLFLVVFGFLFFGLNLDSSLKDTIFFGIIEAAGAIFGLFGLIYQEKENKKIESARFIVELNQNYLNDVSHQELIAALEESSDKWDPQIRNSAIQHLDFFEPFCILVENKIIKIGLIDDLFSYRFFRVVNDMRVQKDIIGKEPDSYRNIIVLHYIWKQQKLKKEAKIPFDETDLSKQDWYRNTIEHEKKVSK